MVLALLSPPSLELVHSLGDPLLSRSSVCSSFRPAGRARKLPFLECKQGSLLTLLVAYVGGKEGVLVTKTVKHSEVSRFSASKRDVVGSFVALGHPRFQVFQKLGVCSVKLAGFFHPDLFDAVWFLLQVLAFCCYLSWSSAATACFCCKLV
ncbi:hypothetical protein Acr_00g0068650 [Actinidia rufa]|uniref:Uncharacterized protein n=1 Tax=Actinidia rufa TaxID=165716 RepID=A0A7J0DSJ4_9ERIC|nr:hypothetical protein Acr_00g0068650 [Actinidia rufa]